MDHNTSGGQDISRQERREAKRAERDQAQSAERWRTLMRRSAVWLGGLGVLTFLGWTMYRQASKIPLPTGDGALAVPVSAADWSKGAPDGRAVLVEYSDLQCPACAAFYPVLKEMLADPALAGKVRLVYRHFPLQQHAHARQAAYAAEAAGVQGKFWEMHDLLFENQKQWSGMSAQGAKDTFVEYAQRLQLNIAQFKSDRDSDAVKQAVEDDLAGGVSSRVDSTPSFFLNGVRFRPQSFEQFKQSILAAANANP